MRVVFTDFYKAWKYLNNHSYFLDHWMVRQFGFRRSIFKNNLDMVVINVNPYTGQVDDNDSLNVKPEIWLECGPLVKEGHDYVKSNDYQISSSGDSFEQAIINMANRVELKYPMMEWGTINECDAGEFVHTKE